MSRLQKQILETTNETHGVTFPYGCKTWPLYRSDIKKLERFYRQKLRLIMNIKWEDYVTNIAVIEKVQASCIKATIIKHRLSWTGHVCRMSETRLLRQILNSELRTGKRPRGYPLRRYKDQLKQTMKKSNIHYKIWEEQAQNRNLWRQTTSIAS